MIPALPMAAKLAGGAALVVCLTLLILWHLAERRADRLYDQIHAEGTGYAARLSQCRENGAKLETALEGQNQAVQALRDEGAAQVEETRETLSSRDIERAVAQARAQWLRDRPIAGDTECERVFNVIDAARARP